MSEEAAKPPVTIWKFPVNVDDRTQVLRLPIEAEIIHVGFDPAFPEVADGRMALWAIVREPETDDWIENPEGHQKVPISVFGTGQPFPTSGDMTYIGTVNIGPGVWHAFRDHDREETPPPPLVAVPDAEAG